MSNVCFKFQKGECTRGDECKFAHVIDPNAVPPPRRDDRGNGGRGAPGICYAFQRGECDRGSSCRFSHDTGAGGNDRGNRFGGGRGNGDRSGPGICYAFQRGECDRGSGCRFSHDTSAGGGRNNDRTERDWRDRSDNDRGNRGGDRSGGAPGVCYKFQKGECTRGDSCRFSHVMEGEN